MPEAPRIAQPGDIFILVVPGAEEYDGLRQKHKDLQMQYGGQLVEPIHITVERFTPQNGQFSHGCLASIQANLDRVQAFPLYTDKLIKFFAPYWQCQVLRWRVAESQIWGDFRDLLAETLHRVGCPSHFTRRRFATCTILKLNGAMNPDSLPQDVSMPLFWVRELWVSMLKTDGQFEILEKFELRS